MQAQNPEASGDKATTPGTELRLVTVDQLKKIHRELDACQKVIWLRGGFDPAYVTGAQEQLKEIEALMEKLAATTDALVPCCECHEGLRMIDPYDGGTFITCTRCNGRGMLTTCPTCFGAVPADRDHLLSTESPAAAFLAVLKDAKANALDVFAESHDDAKQAIEYMAALLEVSDLAKQGGAA